MDILFRFYRTMHVLQAQYCYRKSSVRPSVTLTYHGHIGRTSSKLITRIISLGSSLLKATTSAIQSKGNIPKIQVELLFSGHTKRRWDAGTDNGTAGEVIRLTCSCPMLIVKDDGTDDGLTFRHCCASHSGGDGTVRLTGLSDKLSRHLTVYPGLSHLMTDIAVTRCYNDERCIDLVQDFLTSNHAMLFSAWI